MPPKGKMRKTVNCVNCGAPKDVKERKCKYCGTSYFDMTSIDFTSGQPVALQLMIQNGKGKAMITLLAVPSLYEIDYEPEATKLFYGYSERTYISSMSMSLGVKFDAVHAYDGTMLEIQEA